MEPMNWFDQWIIHFINSFAHRSWIVDSLFYLIANNSFIDAGVLMALFWWVWIEYGKEHPEKREILAINLLATTFAVILARILALSLPYRERPIRNPQVHFTRPFTSNPHALIHWSSFPSDHAVLAFCVATGLWLVSRRLGTLALAYAFVTVGMRVYTGAHYPTDVIAGAALGIAMALLSKSSALRNAVGKWLDFLDRYPAYLYALLFCWTFEIGEMFESLRHIAVLAAKSILLFPAWQTDAAAILLLAVLFSLLAWRRLQGRKTSAASQRPPSPPAQ
jgi:undecaprenyl-diphosphatase